MILFMPILVDRSGGRGGGLPLLSEDPKDRAAFAARMKTLADNIRENNRILRDLTKVEKDYGY